MAWGLWALMRETETPGTLGLCRMGGGLRRQTVKEPNAELSFISNVTGLSLMSGSSLPGRPTLQMHRQVILRLLGPRGSLRCPEKQGSVPLRLQGPRAAPASLWRPVSHFVHLLQKQVLGVANG